MYIEDFITVNQNWEDLLTKPPYNIKIVRDGGYILLKYDQLNSDFSLPVVQECRGIIFRESDMKCMCLPFKKFFNYGEPLAAEVDWNSSRLSITEKIDGSLIKVWYDSSIDEWRLSTNGTIDAFLAPVGGAVNTTYGDLFIDYCCDRKFDFYTLDKNYTHLFELVSPITRVVIPYPELDVYYLTSIRTDSFYKGVYEYDYSNTLRQWFNLPERLSTTQHISLENLVNVVQQLDWTHEGFVVSDGINGINRIKVKSPAYVLAHYGRMNGTLSWESLVQIVLDNEEDEFLTYADEWSDQISKIKEKLCFSEQNAFSVSGDVKHFFEQSRADYAKAVKNISENHGNMKYSDFMFKLYDNHDLTWDEYTRDWSASRWIKFLELKEK